jgi:hypothetical protein
MLTFTNKSHLSSNYIKRCVYCVQDSWVTAKLQHIYSNLDTHYQDWIIGFAHELLAPATAVGLRGQKFDEKIAQELFYKLQEECEQLSNQAQEFVCNAFGIQREFKLGSAAQKKEVFYGSAAVIPCSECNWENYVVTQWPFTEFDYSKKLQAGDYTTPKKWTKIKERPQRGHRCASKHVYPGFELKPYIHHKTKEWTTDKDSLQKLILREGEDSAPGELANLALKYNDKKKQIGFLKAPRAPLNSFTAGNYPTELVILGTNTFRPSSRMNMFGEGGNSQQLDKDLDKVLVIPDDGYILCERDLSAAENRLLYYITNDTKAISIMEGEFDSHSMTAKMITDILAPGVYDWPDTPNEFKAFAESNSLYGIKFRDFGKKVRHSAERYGKAYTISRSMKCKVKVAEEILEALCAAFPVTFKWLEDFKYSLRYCSDPTYEDASLLRYGNLMTLDLGWGHWSFPILGNPYEDETARKYISAILQSGVALTCFKGLLNMWYTLDGKTLSRGQSAFEILRNKHDANQYQIRRERFDELEPLAQQCMEFESVLRNGHRFLIPTDLKTRG